MTDESHRLVPPHLEPSLHRRRSSTTTTSDSNADLSRLDQQIALLAESVLPRAPYLISVPSDVPYRHGRQFVNEWHRATPFTGEEEALQYMSFLTYDSFENSLLKAEGAWADDHGNLIRDNSSHHSRASTVHSPHAGAQRKKITLKDYQSKTRTSTASDKPRTMSLSELSDSQPGEVQKVRQVNGVAGDGTGDGKPNTASAAEQPRERKRALPDSEQAQSSSEPSRPFKKPRRTPSPMRGPSPRTNPAQTPSRINTSKDLVPPPLVSPTLPATEAIDTLPALLSPTLPSPVECLLLDDDSFHSASDSNEDLAGSIVKLPAQKKSTDQRLATSQAAPTSTNDNALHSGLPSTANIADDKRPRPHTREQEVETSTGKLPVGRRVVNLKYGKRNRKRVEALLKLPPRTRKIGPEGTKNKHDQRSNTPSRLVNGGGGGDDEGAGAAEAGAAGAGEIGVQNGKIGVPSYGSSGQWKKRNGLSPLGVPSSSSSSEQTRKRLLDKPRTPIPSPFKSPSLRAGPTATTPRKDLKSTAMRKMGSSDGIDAVTPSAHLSTRQNTPVSVERGQGSHQRCRASPSPGQRTARTMENTTSAPTSSLSQRNDASRRSWRSFHTKYHELGRAIKHEGSSVLHRDMKNRRQEMRGVLLHVESLLCFMLSQMAQSHAMGGGDPGWRTLLPYLTVVLRVSKSFPHLFGLVSQLAAVCRHTISRHDLDRLRRDLPPHPSSATPAAADDHDLAGDAGGGCPAPHRSPTLSHELIENSRALDRLWLDSYHHLNLSEVQSHFPHTWTHRAREAGSKKTADFGWDQQDSMTSSMTPSSSVALSSSCHHPSALYRKTRFHLPIDCNTGVLEVVKYAVGVMGEWAKRERVDEDDWKCRIEDVLPP